MEHGITKRQSVILQGVAVWLMVYHHIFLSVEGYESVFSFMTPEVVRRIAWFCKICVGIFAFVSGYGMYYGMEKLPRETFFGRMGAQYRYVLPRIFRLYARLWLVLSLHLIWYLGVQHGTTTAGQLLGNVTALNPTYNGAWWYVEQYAKMLLLLPLGDLLLTRFEEAAQRKKKRVFYGVAAALVLAVMLVGRLWMGEVWVWTQAVINWFRPAFLAVFGVGYLMARYRVYERAAAVQKKWFGGLWGPGRVCGAVASVGIVVAVRVTLAQGPAYAETDFVLTPLLIYGMLTILSFGRRGGAFFEWWGRYSAYIWLVHGFFRIPAILLTKACTRVDWPIYFCTLAFSAAAAVALTGMEGLLKRGVAGWRKPGSA